MFADLGHGTGTKGWGCFRPPGILVSNFETHVVLERVVAGPERGAVGGEGICHQALGLWINDLSFVKCFIFLSKEFNVYGTNNLKIMIEKCLFLNLYI